MKKSELNMDKSFREKLNDFSAPPPTYVWDNIQGQMAKLQRKKQRALFGWIAAAAVVVLAFMAGWYFNNSNENSIPEVVSRKVLQPKEENKTNTENSVAETFADVTVVNAENGKNQTKELNSKENKNAANYMVADNSQDIEKKGEIVNTFERNESDLTLIKRINVFFELSGFKTHLAEIQQKKGYNAISEIDKNRIAANIGNFKKEEALDRVWKVGVYAAPGYSSYQAKHSESYTQNMSFPDSDGNANVGGGFSVQYKTGKKLNVESGIYYAKSGQSSQPSFQLLAFNDRSDYVYTASPSDSFFGNDLKVENGNMSMNSTAGVIALSSTPKGAEVTTNPEADFSGTSNTLLSNGEFSQVFDFIEIPFYLRYNLVDSKLGIDILGGLNAGLVVGNNAFIDNEYGVQNIGKTQEIALVNLSGTFGIGLNYAIGKHVSLALEPRLNYYLNSINTNSEVDYRPYRIGVYTGLYYEF